MLNIYFKAKHYLSQEGSSLKAFPSLPSLSNVRAKWLKEPNPEAEELFRMVADVFIYWSKSHVSTFFYNFCFSLIVMTGRFVV